MLQLNKIEKDISKMLICLNILFTVLFFVILKNKKNGYTIKV